MAMDAAQIQLVGYAKAPLLLAWISVLLVKSATKMAYVKPKNVMILVFLLAKITNVNPSVQISATCAIMAYVNPSVIQLVLYANMVYVQTIVLSKILVQYAIIMVDVNPSVILLISVKSAMVVSANPSVRTSVKSAIVVLVTANPSVQINVCRATKMVIVRL